MTELADQVLEFIEVRGHVTYDELQRFCGDDMYRVLDELQLAKKICQTVGGVMSERQRRQNKLDEFWEERRWWEEYHRKNAERKSCHRGPQDPDWEYVK
jgi:hypothetical protein